MKNINKYIAIGHYKGNENTTCIAECDYTMNNFKTNLYGNEFVPYAIITEKRMARLKDILLDWGDIFHEVQKMTSNYRKWGEVTDYIEQCFDIMEDRLENAE